MRQSVLENPTTRKHPFQERCSARGSQASATSRECSVIGDRRPQWDGCFLIANLWLCTLLGNAGSRRFRKDSLTSDAITLLGEQFILKYFGIVRRYIGHFLWRPTLRLKRISKSQSRGIAPIWCWPDRHRKTDFIQSAVTDGVPDAAARGRRSAHQHFCTGSPTRLGSRFALGPFRWPGPRFFVLFNAFIHCDSRF